MKSKMLKRAAVSLLVSFCAVNIFAATLTTVFYSASSAPPNSPAGATTIQVTWLDSFLSSGQPLTNFGSDALIELRDSEKLIIGFPDIFSSLSSHIIDADLYLYNSMADTVGNDISWTGNLVNASWEESTVTWNSHNAAFAATTEDIGTALCDDEGYNVFDITSLLEDYNSNTSSYYGVLISGGGNGAFYISKDNGSGQDTNQQPYIIVVHDDLAPFVDITNANVTVTYDVVDYTIGGSNNVNAVGGMSWTNSLGGSGTLAVGSPWWTISGISLSVGTNAITVTGTNLYGEVSSDSVNIFKYNIDGSGEQSGSKYGRRKAGFLVGWGDNTYDATNCPSGFDYVAVAARWNYSLALRNDGSLIGWGGGGFGQTNCPAGNNYVAIGAGLFHSLALRNDGTIVGWGDNAQGQINCPAGSNYVAIAAGGAHSLALRNDGTIVGWGDNLFGQRNCPAGTNYIAVAAGGSYSLALRNDGTLIAWGLNNVGQTNCPAGNNYVAISCGKSHSLALRNDGTIVGWGYNAHGQTNCPAGTNYIAVAGGDGHSLALRNDGTIVGWGHNDFGQTNSPAGVYFQITAGDNFSLAIREKLWPFIDITNDNSTVTWDISSATIGGTNEPETDITNTVAGVMWWSNTFNNTGGNFAKAQSWTISDISLGVGTNVIKVYGSNIIGYVGSDSVTITRGGEGTGIPFVDITNDNATVTYDVNSYTIGGTNNNQVVG
ncbi:MAG: hypothetical protein DRI44_09210, partial [Chlamydiae bacterium]